MSDLVTSGNEMVILGELSYCARLRPLFLAGFIVPA
jgi:hypothetical protein